MTPTDVMTTVRFHIDQGLDELEKATSIPELIDLEDNLIEAIKVFVNSIKTRIEAN